MAFKTFPFIATGFKIQCVRRSALRNLNLTQPPTVTFTDKIHPSSVWGCMSVGKFLPGNIQLISKKIIVLKTFFREGKVS